MGGLVARCTLCAFCQLRLSLRALGRVGLASAFRRLAADRAWRYVVSWLGGTLSTYPAPSRSYADSVHILLC
jgi:hypothetical protein